MEADEGQGRTGGRNNDRVEERHQGGRRMRKKGGRGKSFQHSGSGLDRHPSDRPLGNTWRDEQFIKDKLSQIKEPCVDLAPISFKDVKYQSRCRLYVTNLPHGVTQEEFTDLFKKYGELDDVYLNKEFYGFVRIDHYYNALKAKHELDGSDFKGKAIRVRFSPKSAILVKNLPAFSSNELVYLAFSVFGEVDYCTILTDSRGQSLDEAVVEYKYKRCVAVAKKYCNEHYYLLSSSLKPVLVEECHVPHDDDGFTEDQVKKALGYYKSREKGPRFAVPGSFEYKYAGKYKDLYEQAQSKIVEVKVRMQEAEQELENESMEAEFDYETERLKDMLMQREMERERLRRSKRNSYMPGEFERDDEQWSMRREGQDELEGRFVAPEFNNGSGDRHFDESRPRGGAFKSDVAGERHFDESRPRGGGFQPDAAGDHHFGESRPRGYESGFKSDDRGIEVKSWIEEPHRKGATTHSKHEEPHLIDKKEATPPLVIEPPPGLMAELVEEPPRDVIKEVITVQDDEHQRRPDGESRRRYDDRGRDYAYRSSGYEDRHDDAREYRGRFEEDRSRWESNDRSRDRGEERGYERGNRKRSEASNSQPRAEDVWGKRPRY